MAGFRLAGFKEAGIYVATSAATAETALTVRVHGDPELARRALLKRLVTVDPNMGMVITMRTMGRLETYALQAAFWLALVLGGLALVLTLSGIFSVLSYLVEQRTKEIGVRMALGATTRDVTSLVLSQSARPVVFRPRRGLRAGPHTGDALDGDASRRVDRRQCQRLRPARLRREPALHRRRLSAGSVDSRDPGRADRSDGSSAAGLGRRPA